MPFFILGGIFIVKKNKIGWILYLIGCLGYIIISINKHLPGQIILNIITGLIAINNIKK